ncbi:endonuclease/exonuclease/phosphatase family protein [Bifidobacterium sp. ESL0775]|uniref:endonuclease/exonuclease/phosphatase family protein n=1 Tax=Bifidobacterium sp. ESL0775 TaxID=2983230 RepID=UPI0023F7DB05|nr:endonuclease/exonuclease/phosphatase family protein [Bifidobacterium sp. ESL0775]WEV69624.1 endonuclease/exonuclease/phosphatase family protein [Bifidobacterium sp. ESL0775]
MALTLSILLGVIALWWVLRFLPAGADGHGLLPYLIAFVRFLWIPSVAILTVALFYRHWIITIFAAILTILTGIFASPWYRKRYYNPAKQDQARQTEQNPRIQNNDDSYTVMTLNCRYGLADAQAIIDAVRGNDVSILALQELSENLVAALDKAGMGTLLPSCQLGEPKKTDNGGFNGIWSRFKPDEQNGDTVDICAADVPCCATNGVAAYSAHTKSPMRGCREWSRGVINLGSLVRHASESATATGTASEPEAVIMGDLNSNVDHPSFRNLLEAGFQDAGLDVSHGAAVSFPEWLAWPRLELDHILVTSGLSVSGVRTLTIPGSDHLALLARIDHR